MIKQILSIAFIVITTTSYAQFAYTEPASNSKDSEFKFTKVAHLDATPVESQGNTGTCWSFATLSFFESELIRMGNDTPDLLSEMFVARKAYESKAEKYLKMNGKIQFSEGGLSHDVPFVIKNYGIVPLEVYDGLADESKVHNHSEMFGVLQSMVDGLMSYTAVNSRKLSPAWKNALNGILDAYLGNDINEFEFKGKKYTPKTYAKEIGIEIDNYISITSFTNHPINEQCILQLPDNWSWGESSNVALSDLVKITERALKQGYTIAWDADVSEEGFSFSNGLAINPTNKSIFEDMTKAFINPVEEVDVTAELRQEGYENKSTTDDHLMHIVGEYLDQNGSKYFLVKNSWGTNNFPQGYLYVSESYFKMKTISVYMHKDALSKTMKEKLNVN
tara:strand:+ start:432 stop:1604 length:1173 start_codon:yes stop_codon:yes gene_type:complete